jgi:hypothetical protein
VFPQARTFHRALRDRTELISRTRKDAVLCRRAPEGGRRFYGTEKFTPEQVRQDEAQPWKETKVFYGGKRRKVRYKEVAAAYWQGGAGRCPLRLLVVAPTPYRKRKSRKLYYRQPAFLPTTDQKSSAKQLLQIYFDRWQIEVNHRDEKDTLGVGQAQLRNVKAVPKQPVLGVAAYSALLLASLIAFVCRPASEHPIEPIPHLRPRPDVARRQQASHLLLDARHALLRRTRSQIPMACLPIAMWPKRVTRKVEALFARLPNTGLRLIQSEFQPRHHLPRPFQCLLRFAATEDHEIIRVVDYLRLKSLSPFGVLPTLQQTVHVQVGEHRAGHPTLRSPAVAILPSRQSALPVFVPFLDRSCEPHLDQTQHIPIHNSLSDTLHQFAVWNGVEVLGQISVRHILVAFAN